MALPGRILQCKLQVTCLQRCGWCAEACKDLLENSQPVSAIPGADEFAAVYIPGGHGACVDLPEDEGVQQFLSAMFDAGKVVSSVCHGPCAFANVKLSSGEYMVQGKKVCFQARAKARAQQTWHLFCLSQLACLGCQ